MGVRFFHIIRILLLMLVSCPITAQDLLILKDSKMVFDIAKNVSVYEDKANRLDIQKILAKEIQKQFRKNEKTVIAFNFSSSCFWIKLSLINSTNEPLALQIKNILLDTIQVFVVENEQVILRKQAGLLIPFRERDVKTNYYIFDLPSSQHSIYDIYLRVNSRLPIEVFASIGSREVLGEQSAENKFLQGIFFGFVILVILYNLFIYTIVKDIGYLLYVFSCFFTGLSNFYMKGFLYQYLFPEYPSLNSFINYNNLICLVVIANIAFAMQFLRIKRYFKFSYYIGISLISFLAALILLNLIGFRQFTFISSQIIFLCIAVLGVYVPYYIYKKGFLPARFFLLAWIGVILGGVIDVLKTNQFLPTNIFTNNAYQIGTALEMLLLSFALADKINLYKEDRLKAKEENLNLMQKNLELAEKNVYLVQEQNVILEEKVKERTLELQIANREILEQNEELHAQERELMIANQELIKQKELIEQQNEELHHTSYRLNTSLRYAKHIQDLILPGREKLTDFFQENFVIYLPKDVVSGDFYWFVELGWDKKWKKENQSLLESINPEFLTHKAVLAMIDCTGHGVPGAFMTMIVHTLLHEIVEIKKINNPAFILKNLHTGIKNLLKQSESKNTDGMDMSVCYFEKDERKKEYKITFAGAKGLTFYGKDQEIVQLVSEKYSIGGSLRKERKFTNQTITLPEGTMLYLASDGYIDQNNAERMKYGSINFKKLLNQIHHLPLQAQQNILIDTLKQHCGQEEQRDDISIVGIKL
ncbi:7TM diverse intracellular signaling domain-containing protein [Thermoflexibacter ruber]|uniref:Serine phosphatase RsbU, regulator of sigma subunit n=1 Tax=Thermoflexibacter ruber TaxID=1003 RepID=A0A1I2DVW5_9BACT|nr:7TM diverse intracellular signaling domain-containing protein [Thermoflexibacter ruber]SFE84745.1 Serine phosphatase RsbU, regulator of sigma subunit [Thermoflexibacter ruber]